MAGLCATTIFSSSGTLWSQQKPADEINPYDERAVSADMTTKRPVVIYTPENAPATSRLEELPLKESVSRYGITWIFEKPARVGQFINGDWYVVGAVTIKAIDPKRFMGTRSASWAIWTRNGRKSARPQRLHAQSATG